MSSKTFGAFGALPGTLASDGDIEDDIGDLLFGFTMLPSPDLTELVTTSP
jgi:hypothetical protein